MARKVQLKNKSGQKIYPLTSSANVMMSDKSGSLDGKLSELESEIEGVSKVDTYTSSNLTDGNYYYLGNKGVGDTLTGELSPVVGWGCLMIEISAGDDISISTVGGSKARAYAVTDSEKKILAVADASLDTTSSPFEYHVLQDGFLVVNCSVADYEKFKVTRTYYGNTGMKAQISKNTDDIGKLKEDIEGIDASKIDTYTSSNLTDGNYYYLGNKGVGDTLTGELSPVVGWGCLMIEISAGDDISISTVGGSKARAYAVTDSEKKILAVADASLDTTSSPFEYHVLQDGFLVVNCSVADYEKFKVTRTYYGNTGMKAQISKNTDDIGKLKEDIEGIDASKIDTYTSSNLTDGNYYYLGNKGVGDSLPDELSPVVGWGCLMIEISAGDDISISTVGGSNARAYAVTDSEKKILAVADASLDTTSSPFEYHVLQDGFLVVNCSVADYEKFKVTRTYYGNTGMKAQISKNTDDIGKLKEEMEGIDASKIDTLIKSALLYDSGRVILDDENPTKYLLFSQSLASCFLSWGIIGDSYGAGEFEYIEGDEVKFIDKQDTYSFGARFVQINNVEGYVFASGGQTAKGWCQNTGERGWGNGTVGASSPDNLKQAYIIQLGSNDDGSGISVGDADTDIDMSDYNNNADTFAGWYAGIIQRLRSVQPKCVIFAATVRYTTDSERRLQLSETIRRIVTKFDNVYLADIEIYGIKWLEPFGASLLNGGHPSAIGHYYQAVYYNTIINWIMSKNIRSFREIQFIGTDMSRG